MPRINTGSNNSAVQITSASNLSPVRSENINTGNPLAKIINISSTISQPSLPSSGSQPDITRSLNYRLRSADSLSHVEMPFATSNQAGDEFMEIDNITPHSFEHFAAERAPVKKVKRSAGTPPEPSLTDGKRTRSKTAPYLAAAKNFPDDEVAHHRLLAELPEEVQQWYARNPAKKDKEGRNDINAVADIYRSHKDFLIEHDVRQEIFAKLYNVNHSYLGSTISKINRIERTVVVSTEDKKSFLQKHTIKKTASGIYQSTTVAKYFINNSALMEAEGITPEILAQYTNTDQETLRKRISWFRNKVTVPLPAKIKNWLKEHPIIKGENGIIIHRLFQTLWESNQQAINELGITLEHMAAGNNTNPKTLLDIIESGAQSSDSRITKPTIEQKTFLDAQSWQKDSDGRVITDSVSIYYIDNKKDLIKRKISREVLAAYHGLKTSSLIPRVDKIPQHSEDMDWKQKQIRAWLKKYGPDKDNLPEDPPEEMIAKFFWEIRTRKENQKKIRASDLIRYYPLRQSAFHYHIDKHAPYKEKELPTSLQKAWLKNNAPARLKNEEENIENAIQYCIENQQELRAEGFTNKKMAIYFGIPLSTFKVKMALARQENYSEEIPPEIKKFLLYVAEQTEHDENSSNQLARLIVNYTPPLEVNLTIAAIIKDQLGVSFAANTLMRSLNRMQKIREAAEKRPSTAAISWLDEFDAEYKHGMNYNATKTAMFYLKNYKKLKSLDISPYFLAERYKIDANSLHTTIARPRIIQRAEKWQPEKKPTVIKQEPEVRLWNQAKWGRDYPVVIPPEDSRIILGLEQGPLRELLNEEDVATLKFISYPAEYRRYQAGAIRQMRTLVQAAQNGTLRDLVKQQSYYYLLCDEEHPELGMGLAAAKDLDPGVVLQIYPGVKYAGHQQYLAAANDGDNSFPAYAFEHSGSRPRARADAQKKRPIQANTVIGGQHRTGDLVFVNTAEIDEHGKVKPSESNNLIALKAGKAVIVYMTTRKIKKHEPLLIYYGEKYLITPHQPWPLTRQIKQEISEFEEKLQRLSVSQPALGWLVENIHQPNAWTQPVYELMPQLLALTPRYRQKNALLVLTDQENIIFKVTDSATGMDLDPQTALDSQRPLAVLQNQGGNHYNCWWAKGRNVSFSLVQGMAGNAHYRVDVTDVRNFHQAIESSGFCMSEAAAMALLARDARTPLLDADRQALGQQLREQVRDFILAADDALCHALEAQIPQQ